MAKAPSPSCASSTANPLADSAARNARRMAGSSSTFRSLPGFDGMLGLVEKREAQAKGDQPAVRTLFFKEEAAVMRQDDLSSDVQPQAGSRRETGGCTPIETLEDAVPIFGLNVTP